jgi:predicted TIM-barrel fold metal-dependent hydrolase
VRIDTHHHMIPPDYRNALRQAGIDEAGGRALPDWSPEASLQTMAELDVATAILSVSTPGTTFLPTRDDAAALARDLNDHTADVVASQSDRFGVFATIPMPHLDESVVETVRAFDDLKADGVVVLVRNGIRRKYPNIRFILSHACGFVPYASHRMAVAIMADTGRSPADTLDDFASFYFDTALSSSAAALPTLLAFAKPGHITFGSDWPFAPVTAGKLFAAGLETYGMDLDTLSAINRTNALALFPRLGSAPAPTPRPIVDRARIAASRRVVRTITRLISTR